MLPICIQNKIKEVLPSIARLHPKNRDTQDRLNYPQLWYCWPRWTGRKHKIFYGIRVKICGFFTGHEISKTEWGYGGGNFVDRHCRWCDKVIRVPKQEETPPNDILKGLVGDLGWNYEE